ncbi:MAG TPA: type II toxin-antitoxin system HicB family antitoxin [Myxococcales bacterium]|nr:type II toxin-antitoxin system HicB family antitoxin [Myxococcales bacterium]
MRLTAAITHEGDLFVAQCLEVDVASQGDSVEDALANLREALELFFEEGTGEKPRPTPIIAPIDVSVGE